MKQVQTTVVSSRPYLRNRTTCSNLKSPFLSSVKENRDTVWCCSKQAKALSYLSPSTSSCGQVTMPEPLKSNIVKHLWNAIWGLYKKHIYFNTGWRNGCENYCRIILLKISRHRGMVVFSYLTVLRYVHEPPSGILEVCPQLA